MKFNISNDKKALLSNFFSLSILQGVNMILPLITLPYLVIVLGVEKFGLINFALSIIMLLNLVVSFGFELSATREVSIHRDNKKKVSEIFSSVIIAKALLLMTTFIMLCLSILLFERIRSESILFFYTFGLVFGNVLFTSWVFQGYEKMKYITYINIASRVFFTALIFVIVKAPEDYIYVPLLNSLGAIVAGLSSLYIMKKIFNISFVFPKKDAVIAQYKSSYSFFLSRLANTGNRYYAATLIGAFFGNTVLGYYSMVEKLFYAFLVLGSSISQIIYPYMSRTKNIPFIKKVLLISVLSTIFLLIPILYYNQNILSLIYKTEYELLSNLFIIMFSATIFATINAIIGHPLLAALGYIKYANNSLIYASFIFIFAVTISTFLFKDIYMVAFSTIIYEFSALAFRSYYIKKYNILASQSQQPLPTT